MELDRKRFLMKRLNNYSFFIIMILMMLLAMTLAPTPSLAQNTIQEIVELDVSAGFDGYYRPNQWLPLRVTIANNGDAITGHLVVRPETSGNALLNTFSTPLDLPAGSNQALFLYISARNTNRPLRVELLDDNNRVITLAEVTLDNVEARDRLYVVVSGTTAGSIIDLSAVHTGENDAFQANWSLADIPDRAPALEAVDALVFNDVDTGTLSQAQRDAISQWVISGGHLIITGGTSWQATAAGFRDILPFTPEDSLTSEDSTALTDLGGDYGANLSGQFTTAIGEPTDDASVLAQTSDETPIVIRREQGNGTVTYLTIDPNAQPYRGWVNRSDLWWTLLSSVNVQPSWTHGFSDWDRARTATEILPGLELLPSIVTLLAFLFGYIIVVGPINYAVLSRLNRRDWAWVTIPIMIIVFSIVARAIGVNLRGNQATLSRVSLVQSWVDVEDAQIDQMIGLLAPRRGSYSVGIEDERLLRPIPVSGQGNSALGANTLVNVDIQQTTNFEALDFPIDASFIAGFTTSGITPAPELGGSVTMVFDTNNDLQSIQGIVRNDTDFSLYDPVILGRGLSFHLGETLDSGDLRTFSEQTLGLTDINIPSPSPLEFAVGDSNPFIISSTFMRSSNLNYESRASNTIQDILGDDYENQGIRISFDDDEETQARQRRQAFLESFILDQYGTTSRGNRIYLAGWSDISPSIEAIGGAGWRPMDTTFYLIELDLEIDIPQREVLITQDQFSWVTLQRNGANDVGTYAMGLFNESELVFRFTPLPNVVLSEVEELTIILDRPGNISSLLTLDIWDWRENQWAEVDIPGNITSITLDRKVEFENYIGPLNAVQLRVRHPDGSGSVRIEQLAIEQRGTF